MSVAIDEVRVVHGDTAKVPYGNGSNASRSTVMGGSAAAGAALANAVSHAQGGWRSPGYPSNRATCWS